MILKVETCGGNDVCWCQTAHIKCLPILSAWHEISAIFERVVCDESSFTARSLHTFEADRARRG